MGRGEPFFKVSLKLKQKFPLKSFQSGEETTADKRMTYN